MGTLGNVEGLGVQGGKSVSTPEDYETVFTNAKAGMDGVDREHVKRVVYEMSKASSMSCQLFWVFVAGPCRILGALQIAIMR